MSTLSKAIGYLSTLTQVSTGNVPSSGSVANIVMYANTSDIRTLGYWSAMTARATVVGGTGAQLTPSFKLQAYNATSATWYDISGSELSTTVQSYNPVGTTHEIAPVAVAYGNIVTPLKIQVPYNHRVVGNFSNPGSNGATYDIYGLLETYKSDS